MASSALEQRLGSLASRIPGPLLALDASTPHASVAWLGAEPGEFERRRPWAEWEPDAAALPSESLAECVAQVFHHRQVKRGDLHGIVVGIGPGSFTGLRVALALVKGLAYGQRTPVFGVSSLALLAARGEPGGVYAVQVDAQRGELFAGVYELDEAGVPCERIADCLTDATRWQKTVLDAWPNASVSSGRAGQTSVSRVELRSGLRCIDDSVGVPHALVGFLLAEERIRHGTGDDLAALAPNYLKRSEAERALAHRVVASS